MKQYKSHSLKELMILYIMYVKIIAKSNFIYRFNSLTIAIAVFSREIVNIIVIYLLFLKFSSLQQWKLNELFFLYSFLFLSYSLVTFLFTGIRDFDELVYEGEFDNFLYKPLGILFQVVASKSDYAASLGHGLIGVILFVISANSINVEWNIIEISYALITIMGGVLIQTSIFMFSSTLSFWTIRATNIRNILFFSTRKFAGYPISIYPVFIQTIMIYIIPFAFVNYFPAQFFLQKDDGFIFNKAFLYATPIVGLVMINFAYFAWKKGIMKYCSVGN